MEIKKGRMELPKCLIRRIQVSVESKSQSNPSLSQSKPQSIQASVNPAPSEPLVRINATISQERPVRSHDINLIQNAIR